MRWLASLFLLVLHPAQAQTPDSTAAATRLTRPSSEEASRAAGAMVGVGVATGILAGIVLPELISCPDCEISAPVWGYASTIMTSVYLRGKLGRGSAIGGMVGAGWGAMAGAGLAAAADESATVPIILGSAMGGFVGGYAGFRYGPGAKGPGRDQRVALVPMATPNGGGGYAVVRF